ncbi:hypothetical protein [Duganella sp. CF517]|nr:hypothetical protein [Duganella sp. CF517]
MRKMPFIAIIVVLLGCIVGYLALDRIEKNASHEKQKAFDAGFSK